MCSCMRWNWKTEKEEKKLAWVFSTQMQQSNVQLNPEKQTSKKKRKKKVREMIGWECSTNTNFKQKQQNWSEPNTNDKKKEKKETGKKKQPLQATSGINGTFVQDPKNIRLIDKVWSFGTAADVAWNLDGISWDKTRACSVMVLAFTKTQASMEFRTVKNTMIR